MKFARKRDFLLIAALIACGVLVWVFLSGAFSQAGSYAEIYYQSELVETVALTRGEEKSFSIPQLPNVVLHLYADGTIAFVESDCPDKVCIRAGKLHLDGQMAACLPNEVYIRIVSAKANTDSPDLVIG